MQGEQLSRDAAAAMMEIDGDNDVNDKVNKNFYEEKKQKSFTLRKWWNRLGGNEDAASKKLESRRRTLSDALSPRTPRSSAKNAVAATSSAVDEANAARTDSLIASDGAPTTPVALKVTYPDVAEDMDNDAIEVVVSPMQQGLNQDTPHEL